MKPIKWTLYFAAIAAANSLTFTSVAQDEPIPDFGPGGPAGFEQRGLRQGGPPANAENQRGRSIAQRKVMQVQIMRRALQRLDLTDEQHDEIKSIFANYAEEGKTHRENLLSAQKSLKTAKATDPVDKTAVQAARDAIAPAMREAEVLQSEVRVSVLNVLTLEQEEKLNVLAENMRNRGENRGRKQAKP